MKSVRQRAILDIIQSRDIDTQEQLLEELRAQGFTTTQATISRDIKDLRLVKELTGTGSYRYAEHLQGGGGLGGRGPKHRSGPHHAWTGLRRLLRPGQHGD